MHDSDTIYHRLFADPQMVEGLAREFAPCELAAELDFRRLQRVNTKFYSDRHPARRREADVIWRLPAREGKGRYLYLLIEFQSESDNWMAARTQVYQGLLWQQDINERRRPADAQLPPLLLLVLYNGARRWNAATDTRHLIDLSPDSSLWPWQPQVRYCLLDMRAFPKDELARRSSLVALLFRVEQQTSPDGVEQLTGEVGHWFSQHKGCERLRSLFNELIRKTLDKYGISVPESANSLEMKMETNFLSGFPEWKEQLIAKAKSEGKAEGKAEDLIALLAERFGTVAPSWLTRIRGADLATLERWFKSAIVAPDLPSVFNQPS